MDQNGTPQAILDRVIAEYGEMPGLKLTPAQASRLWGLDHETSQRLLRSLTDSGVLRRTADGCFVRR